jgi:hypothetical protein
MNLENSSNIKLNFNQITISDPIYDSANKQYKIEVVPVIGSTFYTSNPLDLIVYEDV